MAAATTSPARRDIVQEVFIVVFPFFRRCIVGSPDLLSPGLMTPDCTSLFLSRFTETARRFPGRRMRGGPCCKRRRAPGSTSGVRTGTGDREARGERDGGGNARGEAQRRAGAGQGDQDRIDDAAEDGARHTRL